MIGRWRDARSWPHLQLPFHDDAVARLQPLLNDPVLAHALGGSDGAELDVVTGPHRQHRLLALQLLNRALRHQDHTAA